MKLYKFRDFNYHAIQGVGNNTLWASSLDAQNDPFEGQYQISVNDVEDLLLHNEANYVKIKDHLIKAPNYKSPNSGWQFIIDAHKKSYNGSKTLKENMINYYQELMQGFIDGIHAFKNLSFSRYSKVDNPLRNNLMWAHYANGLRGFCLEFDSDKLLESIRETHKDCGEIEVNYTNTPVTIELADYIRDMISPDNTRTCQEKITKSITSKSVDWRYENETRFLFIQKKDLSITYAPEALTSIIIGEKAKKEDVAMLKQLAPKHVQFKTAAMMEGSYKLEIIDNGKI